MTEVIWQLQSYSLLPPCHPWSLHGVNRIFDPAYRATLLSIRWVQIKIAPTFLHSRCTSYYSTCRAGSFRFKLVRSYFVERFVPTNQIRPATTCIEAKPIDVLESSEALNGAAAVTTPKMSPIVDDFDKKL